MDENFDYTSLQPCSEKQRLVLMDDETDILLVGGGAGGGKSFMSLVKALKWCQEPSARVIIVRKTYPMLSATGGLIDESKQIYRPGFGAEYKSQPKEWLFPNGAQVKFVALPKDLADVQGWQPTNIIVDEGAEFDLASILAMNARLRGARYKGKISMLITCNPDRNSWLYDWVEWCLDRSTGVPVPGTEKTTRWFVNMSGKIYWGSSREDLFEQYGKGKVLGKTFIPSSFRFIPMTIDDNPILDKVNPNYRAKLLAGNRVSQLRYLYGSWTAVAEGSSFFQRDWLPVVETPPRDVTMRVRAWDIAHSVPTETRPDPDYTAGVLMSRTKEGIYYIEDVVRGRKLIDGVMKMILETALKDGLDQPITIPRDPAGGKSASMFFTRYLAEEGVTVIPIIVSGHSGKVQRFQPFCGLCESGSVRLVKGDWNDDFLTELEHFDGGRRKHDDMVDACSDAFITLAKRNNLPNMSIPMFTQPSVVQTIS